MADFFEIDVLNVESNKSGDAITMRYEIDGVARIHVTDGGFQATGDSIIAHINEHYGAPGCIDAVVVSHPDADHCGGLKKVLQEYEVRTLWMLRPWLYADELISRFRRFTSVDNLVARLKKVYPNIAALEETAIEKGIPMCEPFQSARIGHFTVMAPTKTRYLDLVVESEKTPAAAAEGQVSLMQMAEVFFSQAVSTVVNLIRAAWGSETFPEEGTSPENEMSVVQYATLCGQRILLTADAGRVALAEAAAFAPCVGLRLPGLDIVQVPHHGSRHNVSSSLLDCWLGPILPVRPESGAQRTTAVVSAAKDDRDHPRKAVVRAFMHRGATVVTNEWIRYTILRTFL